MPPSLELPAQLGRYRLLKQLGAGGMGTVYLAEDTQLGRQVALKVPLLDSAEIAQRFEREARVAASINHPNLCPILDVGADGGHRFLTMPFIEGGSLKDRLESGEPLPPGQVVAWVVKIARAMGAMHKHGLIHRDLKPHNVLLKDGREPVVMDFGLARGWASDATRLTKSGTVLGTPAYASPEQINADGALGPATDVYSLGVVLYELLTGRLPFDAPSAGAMLAAIFFAKLPAPTEVRPGLDPAFDAICARAMVKKPADRYATMGEFATALEALAASPPANETVRSSGSSTATVTAPEPTEVTACPSCGRKLKAPASARGKRMKCSACQSGFTVGAAPAPTTPVVTPPKRSAVPLVLGAAAVVLLGSTAGWWLMSGSPATERAPESRTASRSVEPTAKSPDPIPPKKTAKPPPTPEKKQQAPPPEKKPPPPTPPRAITNSIGMRLALISAGTFRMGSEQEGEGPEHDVAITRPFYLGAYEVTQQEYRQLMTTNPSWFSTHGEGRDQVAGQDTSRFPVEGVSWQDAVTFCERLSSLSAEVSQKRVYRLPTEAEWEYACQGGATVVTPYHFGTSLPDDRANFGERRKRPDPVGSYPANGYGLYDLHGNVAEWCHDWFDRDHYRRSVRTDPQGPLTSPEGSRVLRGGSWRSPAAACRTAFRAKAAPDSRVFAFGFRVAITAPP